MDMKERGKFSLWLKRMQPFQLGRGADVREWTERHLIIHHHHNHHDSLYDSNTDDAWVNTWYQLPESDFRRSWNFSCSTVIMMELWWWWWSWSWWNFRGYHNDATLVMAMTVTITMSITGKAIVIGTLLDRVPTWLPEASGLVNLASN